MPYARRSIKRKRSFRASRGIRRTNTFRRRRYKRYSRRRIPLLWPHSKVVKLRYSDIDNPIVSLSTETTGKVIYKLNSAYDVNASLASTAMPGFTEYTNMYKNYRVLGAKIKTKAFVVSDAGSANDNVCNLGIYMSENDHSGTTNWSTWQELTRGNPNATATFFNKYNPGSLSLYRPLWKVHGNRVHYNGNDGFAAFINASPATLIYGYLIVSSTSGGAVSVNVALKTEVTLYVKFYVRASEVT